MNKIERIESINRLLNTNNVRINYAKKRLQEDCHNPHLKIRGIQHLEKENKKLQEELNRLQNSYTKNN